MINYIVIQSDVINTTVETIYTSTSKSKAMSYLKRTRDNIKNSRVKEQEGKHYSCKIYNEANELILILKLDTIFN